MVEENSWQACCIGLCLFVLIFPLEMMYLSKFQQKGRLAIEQWAKDKEYKILDQKKHIKLGLAHNYPRYAEPFLIKVEDKDGLIRTAYIVAYGDKILEAKWDD